MGGDGPLWVLQQCVCVSTRYRREERGTTGVSILQKMSTESVSNVQTPLGSFLVYMSHNIAWLAYLLKKCSKDL